MELVVLRVVIVDMEVPVGDERAFRREVRAAIRAADLRYRTLQSEVAELRDDLAETTTKLGRSNQMNAAIIKVVHVNRNWMMDQHMRHGDPLPEGFGDREFDLIYPDMFGPSADASARKYLDIVDGKRALPPSATPDPDMTPKAPPSTAGRDADSWERPAS